MDIQYLIKVYLLPFIDNYIKIVEINSLDIKVEDKEGKITHYTKEKFKEMLIEFGLREKIK